MAPTTITVRGSFTSTHAPELATVALSVRVEGAEQAPVRDAVVAAAASVSDRIRPLSSPEQGPVTWWASDQLRTRAHRPTDKHGDELPLIYSAAVIFRITFSDFAVLSEWLTDAAALPGVSVESIEWTLTGSHERAEREAARTAALHDARDKAAGYAAALDLGPVRPLAIADVGLLGEGPVRRAGGGGLTPATFSAQSRRDAGLEFSPQDLDVSAEVEARFIAGE